MLIKKGQPFLYVVFLLAILVIGLGYVILSKPLSIAHNQYYNDTDLDDQDYQTFYIRSQTVWKWLPFTIALGLIVWIIIKIQQKNQLLGAV